MNVNVKYLNHVPPWNIAIGPAWLLKNNRTRRDEVKQQTDFLFFL